MNDVKSLQRFLDFRLKMKMKIKKQILSANLIDFFPSSHDISNVQPTLVILIS